MKRLAVIPSDLIKDYLDGGYSKEWLRAYYNPCGFFDEIYLLSPNEQDNPDLLGMKVIKTSAEQFRSRIKELNIDIVRAYGGNWACRFACEHKVAGVPVIVSVHDTNPALLYDAIKKSDIVFCVAKAVEDLVRTKFNYPQRIWSLPNRVDFKMMRPVEQNSLTQLREQFPFRYRILHVGRLTEQKNLDTLIKALSFLGGDFCVISIGRGNREYYQRIAKEKGVESRCFFIDSVSHEQLAQFYSLCDCMVTPSRWEGFGMVFVEALACEAVVVTSDIAPMNEFITHSENGLLVKEFEDPQILASVVKTACEDNLLRERLKKNARKSVQSFDRVRIDQIEAGYYEKILKMKENKEFDIPFWKKVFQLT